MKFSIASLALVAALLATCFCQILANDADKTTTPGSYFGVDANDAEAVRAKQRELSEDKFRELFGDEQLNILNTEDHGLGEEKKNWSIADSIKKLFQWFKEHKESTETSNS